MTNAIYVGLLLIVGGALLEGASGLEDSEPPGRRAPDRWLLGSFLRSRRPTRTSRLLQALGTVLLVIGLLALML